MSSKRASYINSILDALLIFINYLLENDSLKRMLPSVSWMITSTLFCLANLRLSSISLSCVSKGFVSLSLLS